MTLKYTFLVPATLTAGLYSISMVNEIKERGNIKIAHKQTMRNCGMGMASTIVFGGMFGVIVDAAVAVARGEV